MKFCFCLIFTYIHSSNSNFPARSDTRFSFFRLERFIWENFSFQVEKSGSQGSCNECFILGEKVWNSVLSYTAAALLEQWDHRCATAKILCSKPSFDSFRFLPAPLTPCLVDESPWFCNDKAGQNYPHWLGGLFQNFQTALTMFVFATKHQVRNSVIPKHSHIFRDVFHSVGQLCGSSLCDTSFQCYGNAVKVLQCFLSLLP